MENELSIIESCENCGACCMEQGSPPGYAMLLSSPEMMENAELFGADVERLRSLPQSAVDELQQYVRQLLAGKVQDDPACIWLEQSTMQCRYHDHRPMICRDFEVGSEDCIGWRKAYGVDQS